jgi:hypothetical protein
MIKTLFLLCLLFVVVLSGAPQICADTGAVTLEYEETDEFGSDNVQEVSTLGKRKFLFKKVVEAILMELEINTAPFCAVVIHLRFL